MRMARMLLAAAWVAGWAGTAHAQSTRAYAGGHDGSLLGGETLREGENVVYGLFGWPDMTFGFTHGMSPRSDIGFKLSLLYGVENRTDYGSQFGMAFIVPLRFELTRSQQVSLLFRFEPGFRLYTTDPVHFGLQFPVGVVVGFRPAPNFKIGLGFDFWATLFLTGTATPEFFFGPLFGPSIEYQVDRLFVGLDTRFGAIIDAFSGTGGFSGGTDTGFGLRMQALLGYRL